MCVAANEMFRLYPDHLVIAKDFHKSMTDLRMIAVLLLKESFSSNISSPANFKNNTKQIEANNKQ